MIHPEGWVALKIQVKNSEPFYKVFCTERGGVTGDTCFTTDKIFPDGEHGWTLWSKAELNRLVRKMEDEGIKVERIADFFQHIRYGSSEKN